MSAATTADRGFTWSDDETSILLKLWGANDAQSELRGNKRNFIVYEKISEKMSAMGFIRTASQCREKIKRMKREYTLTKQYNSKTTGPKKLMRFFEQFERILLEKQNRNQRNTTLRKKIFPVAGPEVDDFEYEEPSIIPEKTCHKNTKRSKVSLIPKLSEESGMQSSGQVDKDIENPWAPAVVLVEGDQSSLPALQESCSTVSPSSLSGEPTARRKRKVATKMALFQSMMDSLTLKFMKYQEEADTRFLERFEALDDDRQKMEHNVQKMWMEFEERRKKDEQDHELNVMSAFHSILNQITVNHHKTSD